MQAIDSVSSASVPKASPKKRHHADPLSPIVRESDDYDDEDEEDYDRDDSGIITDDNDEVAEGEPPVADRLDHGPLAVSTMREHVENASTPAACKRSRVSHIAPCRRDFRHVRLIDCGDVHPGRVRVDYVPLAAAIPHVRPVSGPPTSPVLKLTLQDVGGFYELRITSPSNAQTRPLVSQVLADPENNGNATLDPLFVWMTSFHAPSKASEASVEKHRHSIATKEAATQPRERCRTSHPSGVSWRSYPVAFSDMSVPHCNPLVHSNRFHVSTQDAPFVLLTGADMPVADVNKSKTKISRMLFRWDIVVREFTHVVAAAGGAGSNTFQERKLLSYSIRLPVVLDCSVTNMPPVIVSPYGGVFDTDKLHLELGIERMSVSYDTIIIKKITLKDLARTREKLPTQSMLSFVDSVPERYYSAPPQAFELNAFVVDDNRSNKSLRGIRARHYLLVRQPASSAQIPVAHRMFEGGGGTDNTENVVVVVVPLSGSTLTMDGNALRQTHALSGWPVDPLYRVTSPIAIQSPLPSGLESLRAVAADQKGRVGVDLDSVVGLISAFWYQNLRSDVDDRKDQIDALYRPFFWRCTTNLTRLLLKSNPSASNVYPLAEYASSALNVMYQERTEKQRKSKKGACQAESWHYDLDATFVYASSCSLAYSKAAKRTNIQRQLSMAVARSDNDGSGDGDSSSTNTVTTYCNVPDFFPPQDTHPMLQAMAEIAARQFDTPQARCNALASQQRYLLKQLCFTPERLLWGLEFELCVHNSVSSIAREGGPNASKVATVGDMGRMLLVPKLDQYHVNKDMFDTSATHRSLLSRLYRDVFCRTFNSLLWPMKDFERFETDAFLRAAQSAEVIQRVRTTRYHANPSSPIDLYSLSATNININDAAAAPVRSITQLLDDMPNLPCIRLVVPVIATSGNTGDWSDKEYRLDCALLAQQSRVALAQIGISMSKNKDLIRVPADHGAFGEESAGFVQALAHHDTAESIRIYRGVFQKDLLETNAHLPLLNQSGKYEPIIAGNVLASFLWDSLRLADFLESDSLCMQVLSYIICESELVLLDSERSVYSDPDRIGTPTLTGMPCAGFFKKYHHRRGFTATRNPQLNGFTLFMAFHALCNPDIALRRGLEFLFRGIEALVGSDPDLYQWATLGHELMTCTGHFANFDKDLIVQLKKHLVKAKNLRIKLLRKEYGAPGPLEHNYTTCVLHTQEQYHSQAGPHDSDAGDDNDGAAQVDSDA